MISRRQLFKKAAAAIAGIPFFGVLKPSEPLDRTVEAKATPKTPKGETSGFIQHGYKCGWDQAASSCDWCERQLWQGAKCIKATAKHRPREL